MVVVDSSIALDKPDAAQVGNIWSKILPKAIIDSDGNLKIHGSIVLQPSATIVHSNKKDSDIHMTLDEAPVEETEEDTLNQQITTENIANTVLQRLRQHNFDDSATGEINVAPLKHSKPKFKVHDEDNTANAGEVYEPSRLLYRYSQKLGPHGYDKPENQSDGNINFLTSCHQQSSLIFVEINDTTNENDEPENPNEIEDTTFLEHRFRGRNRYSVTADSRRVINDKRELTFKSNPGAVHNGDGFHMENDLKERMIEDEVRKLLHLQEQAMKYGNIVNPTHIAEANNPNLGFYTTRNVRGEGIPFEYSKLRRVATNPEMHAQDFKSKIRPMETVSGTLDFYKTENIDLDMDSEIQDLFKDVKLFKKSEESYGHTIIEDPVTPGSTMHFQVTFQPSGLLNENIVKGLNTHFLLGLDTEAVSKKVADKNSYDYSEDRGLKQKSQLTESMPDKSSLIDVFPPPNKGLGTSELSKIHNVPQRAENGKVSKLEDFNCINYQFFR